MPTLSWKDFMAIGKFAFAEECLTQASTGSHDNFNTVCFNMCSIQPESVTFLQQADSTVEDDLVKELK